MPSQLLPTLRRLIGQRKSGYVLAALTPNKYGDRSNAIGKRFGRVKKKTGFSKAYVFHSISKTVVTLLENTGVSENVAADIVGHEKPRITYGLYSALGLRLR
jgi:integrase